MLARGNLNIPDINIHLPENANMQTAYNISFKRAKDIISFPVDQKLEFINKKLKF